MNLGESIDSLDFLCLAILKFDDQKNQKHAIELLNKVLRNSDAFFNEGNSFVYLVLPGTDESGATDILEDFREFFNNKFKYKVLELKQENIKDLGKILFDIKKSL